MYTMAIAMYPMDVPVYTMVVSVYPLSTILNCSLWWVTRTFNAIKSLAKKKTELIFALFHFSPSHPLSAQHRSQLSLLLSNPRHSLSPLPLTLLDHLLLHCGRYRGLQNWTGLEGGGDDTVLYRMACISDLLDNVHYEDFSSDDGRGKSSP